MQAFEGYENVKTNDYGERLEVGGHTCKILDVKQEDYTTKDNKTFSKLRCKIDICEPDKQAGFYERKFKNDAEKDAMTAKWKGYFDVTIPKNDSEDIVKQLFKTFITSVEHSNPGYDWIKSNWDEKTLIGKKFGLVFGLEEFVLPSTGNTITFCRGRFARSTEKIEEAPIPKVKLLDGTYKDYEQYMRDRNNNNNSNNNSNIGDSNEDVPTSQFANNDDLPF